MYVRLALILAVLAQSPCATADPSNKDLMKACAKKTIVMGREDGKLVKAGERVDGFCAGYLQATLNALTNTATCKPQGDDADFLLSIYTQYMKDKTIPESANASKTLTQAFRRIAQCK
jgi:hypothetical protein